MGSLRPPSSRLEGLVPYDPKYIPAEVMLSANENPSDVPEQLRQELARALKGVPFNRYPDPLGNQLRATIAEANGLEADWVLLGNGGDELLFNVALAWGGSGRTFLDLPPTFSVYAANAQVTNTTVVSVARRADFSIDEEAVLARVAQGDIDYVIVASPNNPTGQLASEEFLLRLLDATDALVLVDEAYFEFSHRTMRPYLESHENLLILRTFSKAFSLAGVRLGYLLGHPSVIRQFLKVRQPYSVDALSQAVGQVVFQNRALFQEGIEAIRQQRARLFEGLRSIPGVQVFESDANYLLFRMPRAGEAWEYFLGEGVLVRDFSRAPLLENCLRVSVGSPEQNDRFLQALRRFVMGGAPAGEA